MQLVSLHATWQLSWSALAAKNSFDIMLKGITAAYMDSLTTLPSPP
jgi:hypothetical protein